MVYGNTSLSPIFIEEKKIKIDCEKNEQTERERIYYGLTFRGLHYLYDKELIKTDQIQEIVKTNIIKIPDCNEEQFNIFLKGQLPFGLNNIIKALLVELYPRHEPIVDFTLKRFPDLLFKPYDLFPLFRVEISDKIYGAALFIKAVMELIGRLMDKDGLTDNEGVEILGETGFKLYHLLSSQMSSYEEMSNSEIQKILKNKK